MIPKGDNVPPGDGTEIIYFQLLTGANKVKDGKNYYWLNWSKTRMGVTTTKYGWYEDAAGTTPANLKLKPGQAFYLTAPFEDISFEFSGQVRVDSVVVDVNQGNTMIGNPYPVECSSTNIVPVAYAEGDPIPKGDGTEIIYFQELTGANKVKDGKNYYWLDWTKTRMGVTTTKYGWYEDAAGTTPANLTIQPGSGIYITSPVACQFTISGVMKDDE